MSRQIKRNTVTCRCSAYSFPHRKHGGRCNSCNHGKDWRGLSEYLEYNNGEWCEHCAQREEEETYRISWELFMRDNFI